MIRLNTFETVFISDESTLDNVFYSFLIWNKIKLIVSSFLLMKKRFNKTMLINLRLEKLSHAHFIDKTISKSFLSDDFRVEISLISTDFSLNITPFNLFSNTNNRGMCAVVMRERERRKKRFNFTLFIHHSRVHHCACKRY